MLSSRTYTYDFEGSPKQLYAAFTNSVLLRNWLCDYAYINRFQGNACLFTWNNGMSASGHYTTTQPDTKILFTWMQTGAPGVITIDVTITPQGTGSHVEVVHQGFDEGEAWEQYAQTLADSWKIGVENLVYYLKTGLDERIVRRPMLGINIGLLSEETAAELGLPTRSGVFLAATIDGMGARDAGLQGSDLLVSLGGKAVANFGDLAGALQGLKGGDTVEVQFYRGSEKHVVDMRLSERPLPAVYKTHAELAAYLRTTQSQLNTELDKLLDGVTDHLASSRPSPTEWSANENLAHLIFTERIAHMGVWQIMGGDDTFVWPDNNPAQLTPILNAYPTLEALIVEFKRMLEASVVQISSLSDEVDDDLPMLTSISQRVDLESHTRAHYKQMREALAALSGEAAPA